MKVVKCFRRNFDFVVGKKKHNNNKPICQCPTKTGEISFSEQFTSVFPVVSNLILNEQENKRSETTENIKSNWRFFSTFDMDVMDKLGKIGRHHRKRSALMLLSPLPHPPFHKNVCNISRLWVAISSFWVFNKSISNYAVLLILGRSFQWCWPIFLNTCTCQKLKKKQWKGLSERVNVDGKT